jgi:hypothetical protein
MVLRSFVLLWFVGCNSSPRESAPVVAAPVVPGPVVPAPVVPDEAAPQPVVRREGNLVVEWPTTRTLQEGTRLRTHVVGPLSANATRYWAGPTRVPDFVPLKRDALELFLLDESAEGFFALYREPYGATESGCALRGSREATNCEFTVALFAPDGSERWAHRLNDHFSRRDRLEVQDVRYSNGVVYFNEACQSYSREARGRCSSLVALDPASGEVRFRTPSLVSNGEIVVLDSHLVASYGFEGEKLEMSLVARDTGRVTTRLEMPAAIEHIEVASSSASRAELDVLLKERGATWRVVLEDLDERPRIVPQGEPPPQLPSRFPTLRMGDRDPQ